MATTFLGLGSNQGDRLHHLRAAVERLNESDVFSPVAASPVYETEAHTRTADEEQPPFLNAVLQGRVDGGGERLLRVAQAVERAEGRDRSPGAKWQPRPLDIDLLAVGRETRNTETLILPHPRLGERRFVLRPWADLAPNFTVPPPFNRSVQSLLDQCADATSVRKTAHRIDDSIPGSPSNEGDT